MAGEPLTASQRSLRASIAANTRAAMYDGLEVTAKARETFIKSFEEQADPDHTLPPEERTRRGEALRRAHYKRLALKSSRARAARKALIGLPVVLGKDFVRVGVVGPSDGLGIVDVGLGPLDLGADARGKRHDYAGIPVSEGDGKRVT